VVFAFTGAYVYQSDPWDLYLLVFFGVFGYLARKLRFDISPMVMGFILGPILEYSLGQTVSMSQGEFVHFVLVERPIASFVIAATPVVAYLLWRRVARLRRRAVATAAAESR
jgi:putative tricarboxylic transport membrane protein